jgi:hypothetical protein
MPPIISDITRGWRILERGQLSARQKMMMIPAFVLNQHFIFLYYHEFPETGSS